MSDYIQSVRKYVMDKTKAYVEEIDDYDFWNEHIKYVEYYAVELAKKYNADLEIVQLGALLHDMALVLREGERKDHHVQGAIIAEKVLREFGYDVDGMKRVIKCVYNHRSSKNAESIEEMCVADADILAHFANIPMIFQCSFVLQKKNLREVKAELRQSLQKDYDDLSEPTKEWFKSEYKNILSVLIKEIQ